MGKAKEDEKANGKGLASERQVDLVKSLYSETKYSQQYSDRDLTCMTQPEIQKHIDFLIGYKRRMQSSGENGNRVNGFNEAAFGMVYKLVWKSNEDKHKSERMDAEDFTYRVQREFEFYMRVRNFVKKEITKEVA